MSAGRHINPHPCSSTGGRPLTPTGAYTEQTVPHHTTVAKPASGDGGRPANGGQVRKTADIKKNFTAVVDTLWVSSDWVMPSIGRWFCDIFLAGLFLADWADLDEGWVAPVLAVLALAAYIVGAVLFWMFVAPGWGEGLHAWAAAGAVLIG